MASSDISDIVIFKKKLGLNYEIKQKYVGLKMKENNILSFNFRVPSALRDEVLEYFNRFQMGEPTAVDIGGTGDIKCIFKEKKMHPKIIMHCLCYCRKLEKPFLQKKNYVKPALIADSTKFLFFNFL